ncbi:MAG: tetratricopeptide repeat protein, partial [bacterium]
GPDMVWGGIRSVGEIWDHVTRAQYGGLGEASAETSFALRLRVFFGVLGTGVPALLGIAAAIGLGHLLLRRDRMLAAVLGGFLVLAGPVTAAVIRYEDSFLDQTVVVPYFLPAVVASFVLAGLGIGALDRWIGSRLAATGRAAAIITGALAILVPVVVHQANFRACDRSGSTLARVHAEAVLGPLPTGARLYVLGDTATFGIVYFQRVEGMRPDVALMDRTLNLFVESYGEKFAALSRPERKARRDAREVEIAFAEPDVPVFYSEIFDLEGFGGCRLVPWGVLEQLLRPGEAALPYRTEPLALPPVDPSDFLESHLAGVTLYHQGLGLLEEGREEEARRSFHEAAGYGARIAGLLRNLGLAHLDVADYATAEERFLEAIELEPRNQDALYNLATLYAFTGRPQQAIEWYERLVELRPEHPEVYLNWGIELVRAGRLEEARSAAELALGLDDTLAPAIRLRDAASVGLEVGGEEGTLEARRMVDSLAVGGTLELAHRYVQQGENAKATELYREVAQKNPESATAIYGLGWGLIQAGQYEEAAVAFRKILALEPQNADSRNALAFIFAVTGDSLDRAETLAEEALKLAPGLSAYWYDTLGWVRFRRGKHEEALEVLRISESSLPPDDSSTRAENLYHIGAVLMALGRNDEAAEYLTKSVRRAKDEPWVADLKARARELGIEEASI